MDIEKSVVYVIQKCRPMKIEIFGRYLCISSLEYHLSLFLIIRLIMILYFYTFLLQKKNNNLACDVSKADLS